MNQFILLPLFKDLTNRSLEYSYRKKKKISTCIRVLAVFNSGQNKNVSFLHFSEPVIGNTMNGGMRIGYPSLHTFLEKKVWLQSKKTGCFITIQK